MALVMLLLTLISRQGSLLLKLAYLAFWAIGLAVISHFGPDIVDLPRLTPPNMAGQPVSPAAWADKKAV